MIKFSTTLYAQMQKDLQSASIESENTLQKAQQSFLVAETALTELKEFSQSYTFKGQDEEIKFFKEVLPKFSKELIYFTELFHVEVGKPIGCKISQQTYYTKVLDRLNDLFTANQTLYTYYRTNSGEYDEIFFLRNADKKRLYPELHFSLDENFFTISSFKFGQFQAYEYLSSYLQQELQALNNAVSSSSVDQKVMQTVWTDSKAALIELAYALAARGCINYGKTDIKQLVEMLEHTFHVDMGNVYGTYYDMCIRKKSRTAFLDKLKESLEKRMDDTIG